MRLCRAKYGVEETRHVRVVMVQKVANPAWVNQRMVDCLMTSSKFLGIFFRIRGVGLIERRKRDWLCVPYAVPKIQWPSGSYCPPTSTKLWEILTLYTCAVVLLQMQERRKCSG